MGLLGDSAHLTLHLSTRLGLCCTVCEPPSLQAGSLEGQLGTQTRKLVALG